GHQQQQAQQHQALRFVGATQQRRAGAAAQPGRGAWHAAGAAGAGAALGAQAHGAHAHGAHAHGAQAHGAQAHGAQAHGAQAHGAQAHGAQAHGAQAHGAHAHGAHAHDAQAILNLKFAQNTAPVDTDGLAFQDGQVHADPHAAPLEVDPASAPGDGPAGVPGDVVVRAVTKQREGQPAVRVYAKPGGRGPFAEELPNGTEVQIFEREGDWSHISFGADGKKQGWAKSSNLSHEDDSADGDVHDDDDDIPDAADDDIPPTTGNDGGKKVDVVYIAAQPQDLPTRMYSKPGGAAGDLNGEIQPGHPVIQT
ncbi:MAG TPA: SH3 domain-containing protein, partial [Myxococcales bacterium]|nr:SH3 domain-containing protein [Myxococcales bacterium]